MLRLGSRIAASKRLFSMSCIRLDASAGVPFASASHSKLALDRQAGASSARSAIDFAINAISHPKSQLIVFSDLSPVCVHEEAAAGGGPHLAKFGPLEAIEALGLSSEIFVDKNPDAPPFSIMGQFTSGESDGGYLIAIEVGSLDSVRSNAASSLRPTAAATSDPINWKSRDATKACIRETIARLQPLVSSPLRAEQPRSFMLAMSATATDMHLNELQTMGMARAVLQWHGKTQFCSECGGRTAPKNGGSQRICVGHPESESGAISGCGVTHYPRTDPVVIAAVLSPDLQHVLLGRQAGFPAGMYSCLAGFLDPCETVEEGVRREVMEEAGVAVGAVQVVQTQPWPVSRGAYAQIMIGCIAVATSDVTSEEGGMGVDGDAMRLELPSIVVDEAELETAAWVPVAEAAEALDQGAAMVGLPRPPRKTENAGTSDGASAGANASAGAESAESQSASNPVQFLPGPYAIAHHLVRRAVAIGRASASASSEHISQKSSGAVVRPGRGSLAELSGWLSKL